MTDSVLATRVESLLAEYALGLARLVLTGQCSDDEARDLLIAYRDGVMAGLALSSQRFSELALDITSARAGKH